jgi:hypothetical protein
MFRVKKILTSDPTTTTFWFIVILVAYNLLARKRRWARGYADNYDLSCPLPLPFKLIITPFWVRVIVAASFISTSKNWVLKREKHADPWNKKSKLKQWNNFYTFSMWHFCINGCNDVIMLSLLWVITFKWAGWHSICPPAEIHFIEFVLLSTQKIMRLTCFFLVVSQVCKHTQPDKQNNPINEQCRKSLTFWRVEKPNQ